MALTLNQIIELMDTFRTSKGEPRKRHLYSELPISSINAMGWAGTRSILYRSQIQSEFQQAARSDSPKQYLTYIQFYDLQVEKKKTTKTPTPLLIDGTNFWFSIPTAESRCSMSCMCFAKDTLIPLADGHSVPIADLVGREEFYVYSFDINQEKVVIGRGHSATKTGTREVVKVMFDNSTSVTVTDDHKFLLKDGTYKEVKDIGPDDSIESLYRATSDKNDYVSGYEKILQAHHNTYEFTHVLADDFNKMRGVNNYEGTSRVRHHNDLNNRNNNPNNIVGMRHADHQYLHACMVKGDSNPMRRPGVAGKMVASRRAKGVDFSAIMKQMAHSRTEESFRAIGDAARKRCLDGECVGMNNMIALSKAKIADGTHHWLQPEHKVNVSKIQKELAKSGKHVFQSEEHRMATSIRNSQILAQEGEQKKRMKGRCLRVVRECLTRFGSFTRETAREVTQKGLPSFDYISSHYRIDRLIDQASNHKIVRIEKVGIQDVYCFTVDNHHNFAIDLEGGKPDSSGIFVHNCQDFTYTWEKQLFDAGSLIGRWRPYQRKTTYMPPRNPQDVPGFCKHVWTLIRQLSTNDLLYQK